VKVRSLALVLVLLTLVLAPGVYAEPMTAQGDSRWFADVDKRNGLGTLDLEREDATYTLGTNRIDGGGCKEPPQQRTGRKKTLMSGTQDLKELPVSCDTGNLVVRANSGLLFESRDDQSPVRARPFARVEFYRTGFFVESVHAEASFSDPITFTNLSPDFEVAVTLGLPSRNPMVSNPREILLRSTGSFSIGSRALGTSLSIETSTTDDGAGGVTRRCRIRFESGPLGQATLADGRRYLRDRQLAAIDVGQLEARCEGLLAAAGSPDASDADRALVTLSLPLGLAASGGEADVWFNGGIATTAFPPLVIPPPRHRAELRVRPGLAFCCEDLRQVTLGGDLSLYSGGVVYSASFDSIRYPVPLYLATLGAGYQFAPGGSSWFSVTPRLRAGYSWADDGQRTARGFVLAPEVAANVRLGDHVSLSVPVIALPSFLGGSLGRAAVVQVQAGVGFSP
jgi:hypothetical protein